jgi:cell division protein FtsL
VSSRIGSQPYKQKRKTKASAAREKGLHALADALWARSKDTRVNVETLARPFVDGTEVADVDAALAGARDILAERIGEDPGLREQGRRFLQREGRVTATLVKDKDTKDTKDNAAKEATQRAASRYLIYSAFSCMLRSLNHVDCSLNRTECYLNHANYSLNQVPDVFRLQLHAALPESRRVFTESRRLFTESRQLFTESRRLFTESRRLFTESRRLFTESLQLFTESRQLFTESRRLFTESRRLFTESRRLFTESRRLFTESPQLFTESRRLLTESRRLFTESGT